MTSTTATWYAHSSSKNVDQPVVLHFYEVGYFGTYATPVCGTSSFFRLARPARKNSALPKCRRCAAMVAAR